MRERERRGIEYLSGHQWRNRTGVSVVGGRMVREWPLVEGKDGPGERTTGGLMGEPRFLVYYSCVLKQNVGLMFIEGEMIHDG